MRYGITLGNFGHGGDPAVCGELAALAEGAGWEGVFVWDAIPFMSSGIGAGYDAWLGLAAAAMRTATVKLGTMITPLAWRKPAQVAFQALGLDHLSKGRAVLPVGLGALHDDRAPFGEEPDRRTRAEMLDEALDIVTGLWTGKPYEAPGPHFAMDAIRMLPRPIQKPRIPIWVVGAWPRPKSMNRAVKWDGVLPNFVPRDGRSRDDFAPSDLADMVRWIRKRRRKPFDVVCEGDSKSPDTVRPWADAGATWWLEAVWTSKPAKLRERIAKGPPRL